MMSIGMHCRLLGRPGRFAALRRFLDSRRAARPRLGLPPHRHRAALDRAASHPLPRGPVMTTPGRPALGHADLGPLPGARPPSARSQAALTRVFLSPEQRAANELDARLDARSGHERPARRDRQCRRPLRGRRTPGAPCLMLGSHLDTVRNAGKYDGMLGVVAAIDCVHALNERGTRLPFALEVVGFARRGRRALRRRRCSAAARSPAPSITKLLDNRDKDGTSMREALAAFGLDPARIGDAARRRADLLAYAELHIEQGPVLEAEGLPVGVVTAINGVNRFTVDIDGMAGHAGTVPDDPAPRRARRRGRMRARDRSALRTRAGARRHRRQASKPRRAPPTSFPAHVALHDRPPRAVGRAAPRARPPMSRRPSRSICARRDVKVDDPPDARRQDRHVRRRGCRSRSAPRSPPRACRCAGCRRGAGHDGMAIVDLVDIGMLFVRCERGISHNPLEAITVEDAELSARVFLRFIENFRR